MARAAALVWRPPAGEAPPPLRPGRSVPADGARSFRSRARGRPGPRGRSPS
ncbi:MAG: hypothetical protein MZU79_04440 [Anaerotruncus sp.]|nr:hypothetical protein [Anaerotruncus sp.]